VKKKRDHCRVGEKYRDEGEGNMKEPSEVSLWLDVNALGA